MACARYFLKVGSKDAVQLSFEQVPQAMLHALIDSNFKFYKKVQDDQDIAREISFLNLFPKRFVESKVGLFAETLVPASQFKALCGHTGIKGRSPSLNSKTW